MTRAHGWRGEATWAGRGITASHTEATIMGKGAHHHPTARLMNIGRRVDYAIRALSYLAAQPPDKAVSRREIQSKQDVPAHFLSKIMKQLASGGLVHSYMGAHGGFALKKPAPEISLKEV
ncbi:MAG: Rrf2 family transcriptional regulator, partial [Deltaproteobacteria bacterium]